MIDNTTAYAPETTSASKAPRPRLTRQDELLAELKVLQREHDEVERISEQYRLRRNHAENVMHDCSAKLTRLRLLIGDKLEQLAGG